MNDDSVVDLAQAGRKLPHPPTPAHVTMRRSMGLVFDPLEVAADSLFRHNCPAASAFQLHVMLQSWMQTPAGSLPNDLDLIYALVRGMFEDYSHLKRDFFRHRAAILRGWYLCRDGRLHHPYVAAQVARAWTARRKNPQRDEEF